MTVITFFDSTLEPPLGFFLPLLYSFSPLLGVALLDMRFCWDE